MSNKAINEFGFRRIEIMFSEAEVGNTLLDLHNSLYPTQPHSLITN